MTEEVDLFVVGAGSGGVRAARISSGYGARVMIAEEYRVGGTCVIRGCVPKKLLVYASRFAYEFEDAAAFGWTIKGAKFDWPTLIANKDKEIARLEAAYRATLARNKVEIAASRAVLEDAHTIRLLKNGARVRAGKILVAAGGHPVMPEMSGAELAISSNEAFYLEKFPRRILIQGAGYVGLEFACLFAGLGAQVTLVHRGDEILRGFDDDVRHHVRVEMEERGIRFVLKHTVAAIEKQGRVLCARLSDGVTHNVDQVMFATGRRANTAGMGLVEAGVALDSRGAIAVDAASCSSVPSIYAIGDVTDRLQLTPVAIREGQAFADSAFGNKPWNVDHINVPTAVFCEPEIGVVGLSEADSRARGREIDIYRTSFRPMKATLSGRATSVLMKLVVDHETDRVLGVHIVGEGAAEMIQMVAIAVKMGAKKSDLDATLALHPTSAEELVTLRAKV
ncbi:MAG: glutathione-disulfide reductase [Xanthobacteraceae bacterium]